MKSLLSKNENKFLRLLDVEELKTNVTKKGMMNTIFYMHTVKCAIEFILRTMLFLLCYKFYYSTYHYFVC